MNVSNKMELQLLCREHGEETKQTDFLQDALLPPMSPFTKVKTEPTIVSLPSEFDRLSLSIMTPEVGADLFSFSGLVKSCDLDETCEGSVRYERMNRNIE